MTYVLTGIKSDRFKAVILSFSALIVYSSSMTAFGYIFDERLYCRLASALVTGLLGCLYLKTVLKEPAVYEPPDRRFLIASGVTIFIFVIASTFTTNVFLHMFTDGSNSAESLSIGMTLLSIFMSVVIAPFAEEVIFRGFMCKQLSVFGQTNAIILSSVIFALWHGTVVHLYTAYFGGLILACIYSKTKKLRYSIFAHMLFNGMTLLVNAIINVYWRFDMLVVCVIAATMNILLAIAIVKLFALQGTIPLQNDRIKARTKDDEETSRIVAEVLNERKQRR